MLFRHSHGGTELGSARRLGSPVEEGLGKPQLRQRSKRISPTYVRNDVQFKHRDCRELNMMIFRLARCPLRTLRLLIAVAL